MSMGDFYGIEPGTIPGFAEAGGGKFIGVEGLPGRTVANMAGFMEKLRRMHENGPSRSRCACGMSLPPSKTGAGAKARLIPGTPPLDSV
jgi:hypothetical protein